MGDMKWQLDFSQTKFLNKGVGRGREMGVSMVM